MIIKFQTSFPSPPLIRNMFANTFIFFNRSNPSRIYPENIVLDNQAASPSNKLLLFQ